MLHILKDVKDLATLEKFKPSMVISLSSLLFPLTFGKGIIMSSVAPFKGFGSRNPGNFGMRNQESTACNLKSKTVLHTLTLGHVQPSCCVGCPVLVLELKSCMLMAKLRHRNLPGPPRLSLFSMLLLHYFQRVYNLQNNN